jgi:hypothetical protein
VSGLFAVCLALQLALNKAHWAGPTVLLAMAMLSLLYFQRRPWEQWQSRLIAILTSANVFGNLFLNGFLMPALMPYQAGSEMAFYMNTHYPGRAVWQPHGHSYSWALEFYLQAPVTAIDTTDLRDDQLPEGALVYGGADTLRPFMDKFRVLHRTVRHSVSRLTLTFLNPGTRERAVTETWLVEMERRHAD